MSKYDVRYEIYAEGFKGGLITTKDKLWEANEFAKKWSSERDDCSIIVAKTYYKVISRFNNGKKMLK